MLLNQHRSYSTSLQKYMMVSNNLTEFANNDQMIIIVLKKERFEITYNVHCRVFSYIND